MTKKQFLVEIGRKFINGLPTDVAKQTSESVNHHFRLTDKKFGNVFLSNPQRKEFHDFVREVYRGLPYWDEKSVSDLTQHAVIRAIDPNNLQTGIKFSKRTTDALDEWVSKLLELPVTWEIYMGICNLSQQGLPTSIGKVAFLPIDESCENELRAKQIVVDAIFSDSSEVKELFRKKVNPHLANPDVNVLARVNVKANSIDAAVTSALREVRLTLDILNFLQA